MDNTEVTINFLADRVAELDALLTFVVDTAQGAESWESFQAFLKKDLTKIRLTSHIDVDKWLEDQDGFVVLFKDEYGNVDYFRDNDGLPEIYKTRAGAETALPIKFELVRVFGVGSAAEGFAEDNGQ